MITRLCLWLGLALASGLAAAADAAAAEETQAASAPGKGDMEEVVVHGQDVVIIESERRTIYEYRQSGVLRMVKIVPRTGKPYYLVPRDPTRGGGDLEASGALIPSWKIVEF